MDNRELFFGIANRPGERPRTAEVHVHERKSKPHNVSASKEFAANCAGVISIIMMFVVMMIL